MIDEELVPGLGRHIEGDHSTEGLPASKVDASGSESGDADHCSGTFERRFAT
jgi:hypothetical protein